MTDLGRLDRLLLVCVVAGLALSTFAALETTFPALQGVCSVNSWLTCGEVAASAYSWIGPIPVWSLGLGGFVVLLALSVLFLRTREERWLWGLWVVAGIGFAASIVLAGVEVFLIHAVCPVCLASYVADFGAFAVAWRMRREARSDTAVEAGA